jgi:PAS domain S-box-containing protein
MHTDNSSLAPEVEQGPATWSLDLKTGELRSSAARARLMGYDPGLVGGSAQWWDRALHPDDAAAVQAARALHRQGTHSGYRSEYRAQRRDGEWIWLLEIGCFTREPSGAAVQVDGVLLDITLEREAQLRSQQRLDRLSCIFDSTYQFVGLFSLEGVPLEINRPTLELTGFSFADNAGKPLWETKLCALQTPREIAQLRAAFVQAVYGKKSRTQLTLEAQHSGTGLKRIVDLTLGPILDGNGKVVAVLSEGHEVTDVIRAQETLRTLEGRLSLAAEAANLGLWDIDVATGIGWANDHYWTMLGYEPRNTALAGEEFYALLHPDDLVRMAALSDSMANSINEQYADFRLRASDGSWRWIQCAGRTVLDADGRYRRAGVNLDVTERREAEARQRTAERLESVGKLAAGVAHEINTPVQFVNDSIYFVRDGLYELLALTDRLKSIASRDQCNANSVAALSSHLPYLIEQLPKALERSLDGLKRVSEIVSSMRELAHPDRPEMSNIDLNHVIQNALVVARSEYKYIADIKTQLSPLPPVQCHAGELNQVILNLVVNASHAIAELVGDSGRKGVIRVSTRLDGDSVLISVADTGAGIPENIRHRIFEPFFTTKDVGRGTGQGLAIAHNIIVNRHGGAIDFESTVGKGTVFHVHLPSGARAQATA